MSEHRSGDGFVAYEVVTVTSGTAVAAADRVVEEMRAAAGRRAGFRTARVHVAPDGPVVIVRSVWDDEAAHLGHREAAPLAAVADGREALVCGGSPAPGIVGPAAAAEPGIVAVAIRYLGGQRSAREVLRLLRLSGEWKRAFPGFVRADPCLSADGRLFVNYAQWVDAEAHRAWMADPRIGEGQHEIAAHETAAPRYFLGRTVARVDAPR
ncbi:antibiotic biosynthesis monooxygenase [Streptomyces sp. NPDC090306]|uniref:antibiotic biosynthesis monooxygenase n=1 Tax=Streptomyces sp. NPDC090306 TaxID=3365961 RepID=UPI00382873B5